MPRRDLLAREGRRLALHQLYLTDSGTNAQDVWADIDPINMMAKDASDGRRRAPRLLERVIEASSNPGDVVLDTFLRLRDGGDRC